MLEGYAIETLAKRLRVPPEDIAGLAEAIGRGGVPETVKDDLVEAVRSNAYDILDLHSEFSRIRQRLLELDGPDASKARAAEGIDTLFGTCLDATARTQELVLEETAHGYAEILRSGEIVSHNAAFAKLMDGDSLSGANLFDLFQVDGDALARETETLAARGSGHFSVQRLPLVTADGRQPRVVNAEFGAVATGSQPRLYALLNDMTERVAAEHDAYERAGFGILRVVGTEVVFCNRAAAAVLCRQADQITGHSVLDFVEPEDRQKVLDEVQGRQDGKASRYEVRATIPGRAARRIEVCAVPEFEGDQTRTTSTLAFVRLVEPFRLRDEIREALDQISEPHEMVTRLHEFLSPYLPHDTLVFTIYDASGHWAWPAHIEPRPEPPWQTRWFWLSDEVLEWMKTEQFRGGLLVADLASWLAARAPDDPLRSDPVVRRLIDDGVRSSLTVPLRGPQSQQHFTVSMSLLRMGEDPFTEADIDFLSDLGIEHFLVFLHNEFDYREEHFLETLNTDTLRELGSGDEVYVRLRTEEQRHRRVAEIVTQRLSHFYRWRSVSVFEPDEPSHCFRMLGCFDFESDSASSAQDCLQSFGAGLMGLAYEDGKPHLLRDADDDSEEARAFVRRNTWAKSSLTLPIRLHERIVWLVNVEDETKGAINDRDVASLLRFAEKIQTALERIYGEALREEIFQKASDAIIVVDRRSCVVSANRQALSLTGRGLGEMTGLPFSELCDTPEDAESLLSHRAISDFKSALRRPDGRRCHVLVSAKTLDGSFGMKVIYATELSARDWRRDVTTIEGAIAQAAAETSRPIGNVRRVLKKLQTVSGAGALSREFLRASNSLMEIELTYRRIAANLPSQEDRYVTKRADLGEIIDQVVDNLSLRTPREKWITLRTPGCALPAQVDVDRIGFVFLSILSFLKQNKPDDAKVILSIEQTGRATAQIRLSAQTGETVTDSADALAWVAQAGREMVTLGEKGMRRIVEEEHGGRYATELRSKTGKRIFLLQLPLARQEPAH